MYFVRDISKDAIYPFGTRKGEFISYRNEMKCSYIAFEKQIYRTSVSEYIAKNLASKLCTNFIIVLVIFYGNYIRCAPLSGAW